MAEKYYLALFTERSWKKFQDQDEKIYGTTTAKRNRAQKVKSEDYLICYITKISKIVGVLKVISDSYYDETPVWDEALFPVRFNVEVIQAVNLEDGIPVKNLFGELSIFQNLKNLNAWSGFFINAFNEFPTQDGKRIIKILKNAE